MRFSLPTYLSDLLNVIGCDYVQAHLPLKLLFWNPPKMAMLEDLGLYSMNFLSWNNPWFTVNVHVWKDRHTIFGKNIHKPPHLWCPNPTWKNKCLLSLKTLQYLQFADLLLHLSFQAAKRGGKRLPLAIFYVTCHPLSGLWWSGRTTTGAISGCSSTRSMGSWETTDRKNQRQTETSDGSGFLDGECALINIFWDIERMMYISISFISFLHPDVQEYTLTFFWNLEHVQ